MLCFYQQLKIMTSYLCSAAALCPVDLLITHKLPARLVVDDVTNIPNEMQTLLNSLCPLLTSHHRPFQLTAYKLLFKVMTQLSRYDEGTASQEASDDDDVSRSPPCALLVMLDASSIVVDAVLGGAVVGETATVPPSSDDYSSTMAYLLGWNLLMHFFRSATAELKSEYAQYLHRRGAIDSLATNLFRLMPQSPIVPLKDGLIRETALNKLAASRNLFADEPVLDVAMSTMDTGSGSAGGATAELQHIACTVYYGAVQTFPAALRQWYSALDRRTKSTVDRYTAKHVSPLLCAQELAQVQSCGPAKLENMVVKSRPASREVVARDPVEELTMELVIVLPENLPFGDIRVESGKLMGVLQQQCSKWLLQLAKFLKFQVSTDVFYRSRSFLFMSELIAATIYF